MYSNYASISQGYQATPLYIRGTLKRGITETILCTLIIHQSARGTPLYSHKMVRYIKLQWYTVCDAVTVLCTTIIIMQINWPGIDQGTEGHYWYMFYNVLLYNVSII